MQPKQLKIFPFHTLIIPLFFVWHIYNDYFGLFPFSYIAKFSAYYLCLALIFFLAGWILFRNKTKAGCWATFILIIFFFWGAFHDFLRSILAASFLSSYKFLLPCTLIVIILLTWHLRKKHLQSLKLNLFLNVLFILFIVAETTVSVYNLGTGQHKKNDLSYGNKTTIILPGTSIKPDIFFIIFDEYASSLSLEKYLHWSNSKTDSLLKQNNFFIAAGSKSNYNATPHSIASTLNFDYNNIPGNVKTDPKELLKAQYTITKSRLPKLLEKEGYTIKNYGICDLDNHPYSGTPFFDHDIDDALYDETFWARIQKELNWQFKIRFLADVTPDKIQSHQQEDRTTLFKHLEAALTELTTQTSTPKFVFVHIRIPHDPYYFDQTGQKRNISLADNASGIRDSLYIDQLIYANKWFHSMIKATNQSFERPRVVLIEGDHGRRDDPRTIPYIYEKQFMNLNAWYFSDNDYSMLYDSISPVNSFRIVLNKYFNTRLPLLKDSTIHLK